MIFKRMNIALLITALVFAGCSSMGVEPWDRDILAKDEMQLTGDSLEGAIDDHIYFSKEASSGGRGFGRLERPLWVISGPFAQA